MINILILDIGNSLIKISSVDYKKNKIKKTYSFETKKFIEIKDDIKKLLNTLSYEKIVIGSVVPSLNNNILKLLPKDKEYYFIENNDFNNLIFNKECNINEIGMDILSYSYFLKETSEDSIGISFGTAIFSVIIKNKIIMGISILPSINKAFNDLIYTTELINKIDIKELRRDFGFNSKEAFESGYYHIMHGMISSLIEYSNKKYNIFDVFISGGDYKNIEKLKFDKKYKIYSEEDQIVTLGYMLLYKNFLN